MNAGIIATEILGVDCHVAFDKAVEQEIGKLHEIGGKRIIAVLQLMIIESIQQESFWAGESRVAVWIFSHSWFHPA